MIEIMTQESRLGMRCRTAPKSPATGKARFLSKEELALGRSQHNVADRCRGEPRSITRLHNDATIDGSQSREMA